MSKRNLSNRILHAKRNGWKIVKINDEFLTGLSWFKIIKWCEENSIGKFTASFINNSVAFENEKDYILFNLRWRK